MEAYDGLAEYDPTLGAHHYMVEPYVEADHDGVVAGEKVVDPDWFDEGKDCEQTEVVQDFELEAYSELELVGALGYLPVKATSFRFLTYFSAQNSLQIFYIFQY